MLINLHLFGMWLNFALSAAFITFFVVKMSEALRWQAHMQAERREESMRDQQLLAVATQAAGAAHELGTPLATMSVLLNELRQERPQDPTLQEDLALLQEQVKQCKHTLQQLVRAAEADRRQAIEEQSAAEWLESVLRRWHLMRPEASYRYQCLGLGLAPRPDPADRPQPGSAEPAEQCGGRLSRRPRHPPGLGQQQYLPEYPRPRRRGAPGDRRTDRQTVLHHQGQGLRPRPVSQSGQRDPRWWNGEVV